MKFALTYLLALHPAASIAAFLAPFQSCQSMKVTHVLNAKVNRIEGAAKDAQEDLNLTVKIIMDFHERQEAKKSVSQVNDFVIPTSKEPDRRFLPSMNPLRLSSESPISMEDSRKPPFRSGPSIKVPTVRNATENRIEGAINVKEEKTIERQAAKKTVSQVSGIGSPTSNEPGRRARPLVNPLHLSSESLISTDDSRKPSIKVTTVQKAKENRIEGVKDVKKDLNLTLETIMDYDERKAAKKTVSQVSGYGIPTSNEPRRPPLPLMKPLSLSSESLISTDDSRKPNLPPGRRTPRFASFLFDDTLRLLRPKTMGSYQVRRREQYGDVFKTNIFGKPTVFVTSQDALVELGKQEAVSGTMEPFFPPHHQTLFGPQALVVQSGETHSRIRRLVQAPLSPSVTASVYKPIIGDALKSFLADLKAESNVDYIKLVPKMRSFFIYIALQILLGKSMPVPPGLAEDLTIWSDGLLSAPLTFIPWSKAAKAVRARKRICATLEPLLEQERQRDQCTNSLLGRLISSTDENGNRLSNQDILDNVLLLIFAGSDTTASAATSLVMTLSLQPELKAQLKSNSKGTNVESVILQILEKYPPAPLTMRLIKKPVTVKDYDIPAGWLAVYGFAGALSGKADVKVEKDTSAASGSVAFGSGPRRCPGRYLAALELDMLCRELLQCEWTLKEDQVLTQAYTPGFFPKDGLQIRFD